MIEFGCNFLYSIYYAACRGQRALHHSFRKHEYFTDSRHIQPSKGIRDSKKEIIDEL